MQTQEQKREQWRIKRQRFISSLTPEQRAELFAKNSARRSAARAAKALAEGRTPGKPGPKPFSPEDRKEAATKSWLKYRQKNLEKIRAHDAERKKQEREKLAEFYIANPEIRRPKKVFTAKQKLKQKAQVRKLYLKQKEQRAIYRKAYYEGRKDEYMARNRNRRARVKGAGGKHTAADIRQLWFLQKGNCAWCLESLGKEKVHVDHWMPLIHGGSNDKHNLRLLHATCNLEKGTTIPTEHGLHGLLAW